MSYSESLLCTVLAVSVSLPLLIGLSASPSYAQPGAREQPPAAQESPRGAPSVADVPDWVEPQTRPRRGRPHRSDRSAPDARSDAKVQPKLNPEPNPSKAPLSGLEWLLLAGGGYALHKLREDEGEEGNS